MKIMNPPQGEIVPIAITSQSNEETQELTRLFHRTKKTLPILSYNDLTDEIVKLVLNTFAGYELKYESSPFSINDAKDVTANLMFPLLFRIPNTTITPTSQFYGYEDL